MVSAQRMLNSISATVLALVIACAAHAADTVQDTAAELCPPCDKDALLRLAPADSEAVIVVNNAAHQRRSSAGRALHGMLTDAGSLAETRAAWSDLAVALDWPVDRAFDELLGRRVTLVMRGLDDPGRTQWVVLSEVSTETERRLRSRLRPAPRGHIAGLLSLSVENGRYELVVGPSGRSEIEDNGGNGPRPSPTGNTMILLGPGGNSKMMAELAPMLLRPLPNPPLGPGGRQCDFVVVLRQAQTLYDQGRFVLLTGTFEGTGWDVTLAASPGMVWERPRRMDSIRPWSDSAFRALEKDALVAIMGVIGSTRLEGLSAVHALSGLIPVLPFALEGEPFGQRAALYIREATEPETLPEEPIAYQEVNALGTYGIPASAFRTREPKNGRLSVGLAIETTDTRKMMVEGDQMIARLMRFLESGDLPLDQGPRVQLVVTVPETEARALRLDGSRPINAAIANTLDRAFGVEPLVSWGVRAIQQRTIDGGQPGWWVATMSPGDTSAVGRDAAALASSNGGTLLPRLSVGVIRPAALERAFSEIDPDFLSPMRAMRWVDSLRWDAWQLPDGTIQAGIRLRMRPGPQ